MGIFESGDKPKDEMFISYSLTGTSINDFLQKYTQLKEALYKNVIPINVFNDIVANYLQGMDRKNGRWQTVLDRNALSVRYINSLDEKFAFAMEQYSLYADIELVAEDKNSN